MISFKRKKILPLVIAGAITLSLAFTGCKYDKPANASKDSIKNNTSDVFDTKGKTACWEVTSKGSKGKIYLLGTIHVGLEDTFPLRKEITDAFNSSDYLAVEANINDYEDDLTSQIAFTQKCILSDGSRIYDHIDKDIYEKAKKLLTEHNMYNETLDIYNPCIWNSLIESVLLMDTPYKSELGVDTTLIDSAKEQGKQILEVESVEFQQNMLADFSDETYNVIMGESVNASDDYGTSLESLYNYWKNGDIKTYLKENNESEAMLMGNDKKLYDDYNKVMLTDRNKGMLNKAKQYLDEDKTVFYAVGFMHMIGDDGLVQLLIDNGYTVKLI